MAKDDQVEQGWIDAHSHIWTPDTDRYPLAGNQTKADLCSKFYRRRTADPRAAPSASRGSSSSSTSPITASITATFLDAIAPPSCRLLRGRLHRCPRPDNPPAEMTRLAKLWASEAFRILSG